MDDLLDDSDGQVFGDDGGPVGPNAPLTFVLGGAGAPSVQFVLGADAPDANTFALQAKAVAAINAAFAEFLQFQSQGVNLGTPDVRVINFVDPGGVLEVTRGVGEHSNVITVKAKRTFSYYTSILYPILFDDTLAQALPVLQPSTLIRSLVFYTNQRDVNPDTLAQALPVLQSGVLATPVLAYTNQRDVNPDTLAQALPVLQTSTLVVVVLNYLNQRDVNPDTLGQDLPVLQSGTLVVVAINYVNQRDVSPDTLAQALPVLQSGTLV